MDTNRIQLKTLFSAVALILACEAFASMAGVSDHLLGIGITRLLEITCMVAVVFLIQKNLTCIGIKRSGLFIAFKKGVMWSVGFGLLAAAAALLLFFFGQHPLQLIKVKLPTDIFSLAIYFSVGGVIGPVAEEIFFRGLIFRYFRRWGFCFSLCFTTIIFTVMHSLSSGIPIPQIVGGLLFATAFEIEKNLLVPTLIHILGNLAIFSLTLLTA